jgi:O-antigen ligase
MDRRRLAHTRGRRRDAATTMKIVRGGLYVLLLFSVLAFGTVEVWSESLFEIGAGILFLWWAVGVFKDPRANIYWSSLNWPILGVIVIGVLQLCFHATPYPFLTRLELLRFGAYLVLFFLLTQSFRARADLSRLVWFLILMCFGVSLLGIIQHFTSQGTIYWLRTLRSGGEPFGPYVNRNHFAGFVELTLPIGLGMLIFRGLRRDLYPLATLLTIVPIGALILSGSRGGIVSFVFEVAVLLLLAKTHKGPEGPRLTALAIVALAAVALIAWLGAGRALERFSVLRSGEVTIERRFAMSQGAAHIFEDHPVKGAGLGALVAVYPRYEILYNGKLVDHVHNDYMEMLAETGVLGGLCGLAFFWILFREAKICYFAEQGHFSSALHAGAVTALCGILLHSLVDFNLHIPANALLFLLQVSLATSAPLLSSESGPVRRRIRTRKVTEAEEA